VDKEMLESQWLNCQRRADGAAAVKSYAVAVSS